MPLAYVEIMRVIASGIAGVLLVIAGFRFSFLKWIVDLPGSPVARFTSIDLHEGEGAFGFLLGIFFAWLWMAVAVWLVIHVVQRTAAKKARVEQKDAESDTLLDFRSLASTVISVLTDSFHSHSLHVVPYATVTRQRNFGASMHSTTEWESVFQEAVHEPDPMVADVKIRQAETVIFDRIHDFSTNPGSLEEQALFDALGTIRILRSVRKIPR